MEQSTNPTHKEVPKKELLEQSSSTRTAIEPIERSIDLSHEDRMAWNNRTRVVMPSSFMYDY